jgi:hypothetical protein
MDRATEYGIATKQTGKERIVVPLLSRWGGMPQEEHAGLVHKGEEAQIAGMLACGFIDEGTLRTKSARFC